VIIPVKYVLVALFFAFPTIALAFQDAGADSEPCQALVMDHVTERMCLENEVELATSNLLEAEARVRKQVAVWDEEDLLVDQALDLFEKSVAAFKSYLSSDCEVSAASAAGGNGAHDMRLTCQKKLIMLRIQHLQEQEGYFGG